MAAAGGPGWLAGLEIMDGARAGPAWLEQTGRVGGCGDRTAEGQIMTMIMIARFWWDSTVNTR